METGNWNKKRSITKHQKICSNDDKYAYNHTVPYVYIYIYMYLQHVGTKKSIDITVNWKQKVCQKQGVTFSKGPCVSKHCHPEFGMHTGWNCWFLMFFFLDLFELDAKLLEGSSKNVSFARFATAASIFGTALFRGKSFEGYLRNFLQAWPKLVNKSMSQDRRHCHRCKSCVASNMCASARNVNIPPTPTQHLA